KRHEPGARYFGCGERTGGLDKTGSHQVFWNVDPPAGHNASLNNLYTSIPFLLTLDAGRAWGLFVATTHRVDFDLALEDPGRSWFGAQGGDLVYYVFAGPTPRAVLDRYTELTGRTPMPPLWALGNQQSRYSYMDADEVREVAREFRRRDIPCDVLYLDIHYMDGYRVFTWDRERFPAPRELLSELRDLGFQVVTIVDPGVKVDEGYRVYREGRERDAFCMTETGREYRNVVWPGLSAFPDFTSERVRRWWGEQHRALLDEGVAGIWCDMNEPTGFIPLPSTLPPQTVHPGDGRPRLHAEVHNLYGSLMARATREGLLRLRPDERPLVISRSGFAGLQRHALHWTGDNTSWWEHLAMSVPQLQNLGLSGIAWVGTDVGGFTGDTTGELLARWTELGIFQPFCRNHSGLNTRHQEPWAFGEPYESVIRRTLKLRQRLIPYLYSLFDECHRTGAPILRPLLFDYPDDATTYAVDDELLLGDALLAAPITRPGIEHRHVYLPRGVWFHLWTGERVEGPAPILAHAPLGEPAIYVKGSTPIPLWPDMGYVSERVPDPLTLLVFPASGVTGTSVLYEDAGNGFAYREGVFSRRRITCDAGPDRIVLRYDEPEGSFAPRRAEVRLELRGGFLPAEARLNGSATDWRRDPESGAVTIPLRESRDTMVIEVMAASSGDP
ncbi:MAG: DUF5110 domain-containing protein, partial [Chloroflexi bacterium]|nr:DUF5110 domain-containing protein [Chloroflexota bacterium]